MAKEYIEREAFIAELTKRYCEPCEAEGKDHNHARCRACWVDDMMGEIGDAPFAADVVEVVRCKDCKYFGTDLCALDTYLFDVTEDGFCNYGERRGNNA